jgi:hypothetical protein
MKTQSMFLRLATHFAATSVLMTTFAFADGIPEPGLVMYGVVTNGNGGVPVGQGNVQWSVTGGGSSVTLNSTIANVNGQYFYVARIPFETRAASGGAFTPTPNTLPLTDATTAFSRSATVLGTNATIAPPALSSFNFSKADRGQIERVDLLVNLAVDPALDSDGDGVPNWAEQMAGTNPFDANSVFKASTDIQPAPGGGLMIKWSSVTGKTYSIHRTTSLGQGFAVLSANLSATAPQNQYTDSTATGAGPYFYRIQVNP